MKTKKNITGRSALVALGACLLIGSYNYSIAHDKEDEHKHHERCMHWHECAKSATANKWCTELLAKPPEHCEHHEKGENTTKSN